MAYNSKFNNPSYTSNMLSDDQRKQIEDEALAKSIAENERLRKLAEAYAAPLNPAGEISDENNADLPINQFSDLGIKSPTSPEPMLSKMPLEQKSEIERLQNMLNTSNALKNPQVDTIKADNKKVFTKSANSGEVALKDPSLENIPSGDLDAGNASDLSKQVSDITKLIPSDNEAEKSDDEKELARLKEGMSSAQWIDTLTSIANMVTRSMGRGDVAPQTKAYEDTYNKFTTLKDKLEKTKKEKEGKWEFDKESGFSFNATTGKVKDPQGNIVDKMPPSVAAQMDLKLKQAQLDKIPYENMKLKAEAQKAQAEASMKGADSTAPLARTVGEKKVDQAFAPDYTKWIGGDSVAAASNLQVLKDAREKLRKFGTVLPARVEGALPNMLRSEESKKLQQDIQGTATQSLRQILGAQFTEKEGERIMALSYDPTLSPEANIPKLDKAIQELEGKYKAKEELSNYYADKGTLTKYDRQNANEVEKSPVNESTVEKVIVEKDGQKHRLPKRQLEAAIKQGYKLVTP